MKKALMTAIGVMAVLILSTAIYTKGVQENCKTLQANIKAYDGLLGEKTDEVRALQLTVEQLSYSRDSILQKMDSVRKLLGVKEKNVKSLHYVSSTVEKTDTITLKDTVFLQRKVEVDTLVGDAWYTMRVRLKYPNYIIVTPKFLSQKYITVYYKKETVNPPKKWWLLRLFQKKHKVVTVNVMEESPYIQDGVSRFVEIIK